MEWTAISMRDRPWRNAKRCQGVSVRSDGRSSWRERPRDRRESCASDRDSGWNGPRFRCATDPGETRRDARACRSDLMADRLGVNARGIAEKAAHQIEIVDGMDRDFDARQTLEKREEMPGRVD